MKIFNRALVALALLTWPATADAQAGFVPTESERAILLTVSEIGQQQLDSISGNAAIDLSAQQLRLRALIASPDYRSARPIVQDMVSRILVTGMVADPNFRDDCSELVTLTDGLAERRDGPAQVDSVDYTLQFVVGGVCAENRAARALVALTSRHPDALDMFEDSAIIRAGRYLNDTATLEYLVDGRWQPRDEATDVSLLRLQLARLHIRNRDLDRAGEVAQSLVTAPGASIGAIVRLMVEKDFAPIIARDPATFDFEAILQWQFNSARTRAEAAPDQLVLQNIYAEMLLTLDRRDEALAHVDAALARVTAAGEAPVFQDQADQLNWTHDVRSRILLAMQNDDAALAALQQGVDAANAAGGDVVSQLLNRSADLVSLGRSAEALEALSRFDPTNASPYGQMVALRIRACALYQTGDSTSGSAIIAEMYARAADSRLQTQAAALCANDLDAAARIFIEMLEDPIERDRAVIGLQTFIRNEPRTDYDRQFQARVEAMRARRDVRRAIDRVTERRSFPIRLPVA